MRSQLILTNQFKISWVKFDRPKCHRLQQFPWMRFHELHIKLLCSTSNCCHNSKQGALEQLVKFVFISLIPFQLKLVILYTSWTQPSSAGLRLLSPKQTVLGFEIESILKAIIFVLMSPYWTQSVSKQFHVLIHYSGYFSAKYRRWICCGQNESCNSQFVTLDFLCCQPKFSYNPAIAQTLGMLLLLISYSLTMTQANGISSLSSHASQITPENTESAHSPVASWASDQAKAHCVDSNGTMRGLFSTWTEYPDCHCTCYPNARLAISVCDGCVVGGSPESSASLPAIKNDAQRKPIPRSGDAVNGLINEADFNMNDGAILNNETKRRGCVYKLTGATYHHAEIWMSAEQPCVKCHCQDGTITCAGEPHHCPPLCLPGQQTLGPGPCCETVCRGTAVNSNRSINFSDCYLSQTGINYTHGELVTKSGSCVDQKCLCVNGRWHCLDYCVPLEQLPCSRDRVIVWDPFCCPRCPGNQTCSIHASIPQTLNMTGSGQMRLDGTMEPDTTENHGTSDDRDSNEIDKSVFSDETVSTTLLVIGPGRGVALPQGRCYCVNSKLHCARPGRHIWHDQDCYFVDRHETTYYPPNAHWTPTGDPCTRCQCLENQTYTCAPKRCTRTFLCPQGQQPLIRQGECCPSYCGASKTLASSDDTSAPMQPKSLSTWSNLQNQVPIRPPSIGQPQSEPPVDIKSSEDSPATARRLRIGCRPWDGTEVHPTNRFPPGSRLLLTRPCRSLLCVCARDDRWLCTDHCPPCVRTFESIENLQQIPQPPAGRCCPPCDNAAESTPNRFETQGIHSGAESHLYAPYDRDNVGFMRLDDEPTLKDHSRHQHLRSDVRGPNDYVQSYRSSYGTDLVDRFENSTHEHIKRTLRLYVLIAALILFCIFGFPLIVFFSWHLIRRRRRRERYQYRSRLQRRRQKQEAITFTARKRPPAYTIPMLSAQQVSSESPQTSYSHKNDTSPTYASSKEPHSVSLVDVHAEQLVIEQQQQQQQQQQHQHRQQKQRTLCWPEGSVCIGINETDLTMSNAPTDVPVQRLHQSVPTTPVFHRISNLISNGREPRRVQSALKSKQETTTARIPSYFAEANRFKIEPLVSSVGPAKNNTPVRRALSSVSNKDTLTKTKARNALNRASTWLGNTHNNNNTLSVIGCFHRSSFKRNDHAESCSGRAIQLARLPQGGQISESSTPSGSTTSEQVETFFANDSPPYTCPIQPNSMVQSYVAAPPSPCVIPKNQSSAPSDLPLPSPTRSQHHFIHLNRPPTVSKPQTTNYTNGYEMKNTCHISNLSKPDPEIDLTSITMSESQTPLLAAQQELASSTNGSSGNIPMTKLSSLSKTSTPLDDPECMAVIAPQPTVSSKLVTSYDSERTQPCDSFFAQSISGSPEKHNSGRSNQAVESTFTWPRTKSTQMDPVKSNPLSPSTSVTTYTRVCP